MCNQSDYQHGIPSDFQPDSQPGTQREILPEFQPRQTAREVDSNLKSALRIKDQAHQCSLGWFGEILNRKLFKELGYSSINQYARQELGFSDSKTGDYINLTKKLGKLPILREALNKGELGYTKGRLLTGVADENNEKKWLEFSMANSRPKVEQAVKRAKQEAKDAAAGQPSLLPPALKETPAAVVPVRVNLEMTPTQFARYEKVWEQIRKQGDVPSEKTEALLEIMESFLDSSSRSTSPRGENSNTSRPPAQIHIHQCPACKSSTIQTGRGELEIGTSELERYQCDCRTAVLDGRNMTSIPPATRRKVLAGARHKCQMPGCDHTRFLEIHHIVRRSEGGSNDVSNLLVCCSACHARIHVGHSHSLIKFPAAIYSWNALFA